MNDHPGTIWTAPSATPQTAARTEYPTKAARRRHPTVQPAWGWTAIQTTTAEATTSTSAIERGSPVSTTSPRVAASSTTHGHGDPGRDGPGPSSVRGPVPSTAHDSRTTASTTQGAHPIPWTTPRWTICPDMAPAKA